jgi:hypothetical protein
MANGEHEWITTLWQYAQGAIAVIASAASSAVGWMWYRYRRHIGMLLNHERRLRSHGQWRKKVTAVIDEQEGGRKNARAIEQVREIQKSMQAEMDALNIEVGKYSEITMQCKGMLESNLVALQGVMSQMQQMQSRFDQLWPLLMRRERPDE